MESVLRRVAVDGFPSERTDAALHQLEVSLAHKSTSFGMGVFRSVVGPWLHGADAVERLRMRAHAGACLSDDVITR